ncbi:hypothetical protein TNCV_2583451 [Trichonephila clavipes]|nr:hypothetical protein TNCV_2583451 [Trichonephila clavipes]
MRILNHWVAEGHSERQVGSPCPPMANAQEDRHIGRENLRNHTSTTRTISQEMDTFEGHTQYPFVQCDDACSNVYFQYSNVNLGFP